MFQSDALVVSTPQYAEIMAQEVLPWLEARETDTTLRAGDGKPLFCSMFRPEAPRGTVVIVHGFTENAYKYSEIIYSLLRNNWCVLAYDQRGHGRSWRDPAIPLNAVTHVDRFQDYVDDLDTVCDQLLVPLPKPWAVFGHSMGGAVTALYLEQHPERFSRAVLCAPMIAPNLRGIPAFAASSICNVGGLMGQGKKHPFFMRPPTGPEDFETSCATDPNRFAWYDGVRQKRPEFQNAIPSYRWTKESIRVTSRILAPGAPESIRCPVLLFTAGRDHSVMPEPQKAFISRVPKGRHEFVAEAKHEIYRCVDEVFFPWWHTILTFLEE